MINITGDRHGEEARFSDTALPDQSQWTESDKLIIAGDFGFVFQGEKQFLSEKNKLDALAKKEYEILFVDGNHEGFDFLFDYPEEVRYGAPVRRIRNNVFWLQRGYVYTIEGKTFFVMGGAYSMDKRFRDKYYEISGQKIWFEQELPSAEEYRRAIKNLNQYGRKVDYIITHTGPKSIVRRLLGTTPDSHDAELTGFFDWVYYEVEFKKWFMGHFHEDTSVNEQIVVCFDKVHRIE